MWLNRLTIGAALCIACVAALAHTTEPEPSRKSDAGQPTILAPAQESRTRHELTVDGGSLAYTATAGVLPVRIDEESECSIFYIGYTAEEPDGAKRPLTFVFNGGPGAASAYLHLGALGPRRVVLQDTHADRPVALTDNRQSWLAFTDLVFVDPVGTGYSRCTQSKTTDEQQRRAARREPAEAGAWDVRKDLAVLGRFIRLYLTRNGCWGSPKFLVGESYGGFRAAALSDTLQLHLGIELSGVVLVSPALDFGVLRGGPGSLVPWVVRLPSYAATARVHGKSGGDAQPTRAAVRDVERFALERMLPALATGETGAVSAALAAYIGLPEARVAELDARIPLDVFARELLGGEGRIISPYDGSLAAIDPDPLSPSLPGEDSQLARLNPPLTASLNSYIRAELGFETDLNYEMLNARVARRWSWRSALEGDQGYAEAASDLKAGMSNNPELKVLVAHGLYDLVTPYLGSLIVIRQLALDPQIAGNLMLRVYPGGHMFYTSDAARQQFFEDARSFFAAAQADAERR
jgi:carboxypeptidase C (cathepsin A)